MKTLAQNKKAFADYEVLEKFEAGIQLSGPEVKSIRASQTNLKGSYVEIKQEEVFALKIHVSPYKQATAQQPTAWLLQPMQAQAIYTALISHQQKTAH